MWLFQIFKENSYFAQNGVSKWINFGPKIFIFEYSLKLFIRFFWTCNRWQALKSMVNAQFWIFKITCAQNVTIFGPKTNQKDVIKIFPNLTRKHLPWILFLITLQAFKRIQHRYFEDHLRSTASWMWKGEGNT